MALKGETIKLQNPTYDYLDDSYGHTNTLQDTEEQSEASTPRYNAFDNNTYTMEI